MNITVNHNLPINEAKSRIQKLAQELKQEHGDKISDYKENWNGNMAEISAKSMGMKLKGTLNILADRITMDGKVPLMAKPFKGQIESSIRTKLTELLS